MHCFQSSDHLGCRQYGRLVHVVNDPQEIVVRNALVLREGPHPPVFRQKGVPVMMGKSQGKAIHQTQGPTPALIGDIAVATPSGSKPSTRSPILTKSRRS